MAAMDDASKMPQAKPVKRLNAFDSGLLPPGHADAGSPAGKSGTPLNASAHSKSAPVARSTAALIQAERRRIGQDLHDGICQFLAAIELKAQSLADNLRKKSKVQAAQAGQIAAFVRDAIVQTRSLARGLSPSILETGGLVPALRQLAAQTEELFNVKCNFQTGGKTTILSQSVATHLHRIAQEAVANAIKHAKPSLIQIHLARVKDKTVLTISDNGAGFKFSGLSGPGMGLRAMQYRAEIIGAALQVQSPSKGGTKIICSLPTTLNRLNDH
jgi:signal transduction histidine kinase